MSFYLYLLKTKLNRIGNLEPSGRNPKTEQTTPSQPLNRVDSAAMDGSSVALVEEAKATERAEKTPGELVAKAIVPVKREFLRPPPLRPCNDVASDSKYTPSTFVKEKKSKRQLKRERRQVLLSLSETSYTYIKQLRFWVLRGYYLFVLVRM